MNLYKTYLLLLACLCLGLSLNGQDVQFTQFYNNRSYLNPALTGLEQGLTLSAAYRNQWANVPGGGYETAFASIEQSEPYLRSSFGLSFFRSTAGIAKLTYQEANLLYAYAIPMFAKKTAKERMLHIGFRLGVGQRSVNWNDLVFSDQLDPVFGIVNPTAAIPIRNNSLFFDIGAGAAFRWDNKLFNKDCRSMIGISAQHITQQDESMQGIETRRPIRLTAHVGTEIPILAVGMNGKRKVTICPNIKYDYQKGIQIFNYGFFLTYESVYMGAFYANKHPGIDPVNTNSIIGIFGYGGNIGGSNNKWHLTYSVDGNTGGFGANGRGTHELQMRINFGDAQLIKGKSAKRNGMKCHTFF